MARSSVRKMALGEYSGTTLRRQRVQNLLITENRFPPGLKISEHSHTYPHFTIMLSGGFREEYAERTFQCERGTILVVPQGLRATVTPLATWARTVSALKFREASSDFFLVNPDFSPNLGW